MERNASTRHSRPPGDPELDYSFKQARRLLGKTPQNARGFSSENRRWRYVYWLDEPEQLFHLQADPDEMHDLGRDASTIVVRSELRDGLLDWLARHQSRVTLTDEQVEQGTAAHKRAGVLFEQW